MDDKTRPARKVGAKRVARHAETQRAKGLVRVPVWVPVADKDRLIAYAAGLRIGAELLLPSDRRTAALLRYGIDPSQESKTAPPERTEQKQPTVTRDDERRRRKRKRRSAAKPAKNTERTQEQNQPKTPKKKRNQRRRQEQKAARRMRG